MRLIRRVWPLSTRENKKSCTRVIYGSGNTENKMTPTFEETLGSIWWPRDTIQHYR